MKNVFVSTNIEVLSLFSLVVFRIFVKQVSTELVALKLTLDGNISCIFADCIEDGMKSDAF